MRDLFFSGIARAGNIGKILAGLGEDFKAILQEHGPPDCGLRLPARGIGAAKGLGKQAEVLPAL